MSVVSLCGRAGEDELTETEYSGYHRRTSKAARLHAVLDRLVRVIVDHPIKVKC